MKISLRSLYTLIALAVAGLLTTFVLLAFAPVGLALAVFGAAFVITWLVLAACALAGRADRASGE